MRVSWENHAPVRIRSLGSRADHGSRLSVTRRRLEHSECIRLRCVSGQDCAVPDRASAARFMTQEENRTLSPTKMSLQQLSNKQILNKIRRRLPEMWELRFP